MLVSQSADVQDYRGKTALDIHGRIDCFFNNAGIVGKLAPIQEYDEAVFDAVIAVNLRGVFLGLRHVLPVMLKQGAGTVVNTASVAGLSGGPGMPAYVASKHAVLGLTKVASSDTARHGIRVNAICPGPVETRMMRSLESQRNPGDPDAVANANRASMPSGRYTHAGVGWPTWCCICARICPATSPAPSSSSTAAAPPPAARHPPVQPDSRVRPGAGPGTGWPNPQERCRSSWKNMRSSAPASCSRTPPTTSGRCKAVSNTRAPCSPPPPFGPMRANTTRYTRNNAAAAAHMAQGSSVTTNLRIQTTARRWRGPPASPAFPHGPRGLRAPRSGSRPSPAPRHPAPAPRHAHRHRLAPQSRLRRASARASSVCAHRLLPSPSIPLADSP